MVYPHVCVYNGVCGDLISTISMVNALRRHVVCLESIVVTLRFYIDGVYFWVTFVVSRAAVSRHDRTQVILSRLYCTI